MRRFRLQEYARTTRSVYLPMLGLMVRYSWVAAQFPARNRYGSASRVGLVRVGDGVWDAWDSEMQCR
jgi:hypothetical protein